ncbi:MsnO8 family LLM class oxidoreductase [Pseudomonas eucalypticola]|nr:MsnO8 family LLM class oxidoreductase [Pseudomonas eucalypticola]
MKLTVIDQTPVHADHPAHSALQCSVDLAIACDRLGYYRYWLAEHHNSVQFAGPAPEILLARIASATKHMRIGSGGVMLSHYSPYKVAETFVVLASLFPGRVDLGIGRAPGGGHLSSVALALPARLVEEDVFTRQATELSAFLHSGFERSHPFSALRCLPATVALPKVWMLGSSGGTAKIAGELGMGMALAQFIAPQFTSPAAFEQHASAWMHSGHQGSAPRLLALAVICAPTDEQARKIAGTAVYRKMMAGRLPREELLSPEEVATRRKRMHAADQEEYDQTLDNMIVGSPSTCRTRITQIANLFDCNEVGIVTVTHTYTDRLVSYQLLAKEFELT